MTKRLASVILIMLLGAAGATALARVTRQGDDSNIRDLWITVRGKPGNLNATDSGRVIFMHSANGPNGPDVVESVGRDYVTIVSSTTSTKNVWRYNIPLARIELHLFR